MQRPSGHLLAQAALLASYGRSLPAAEPCPVVALARAIAASPGWPDGCGAVLVARQGPAPALTVLGRFSAADESWLHGQVSALQQACRTLRYIDPAQVEADCRTLTDRLRTHLGADGLSRASWTAIPNGGLAVLDRLRELLGLEPGSMCPPFPADRPLIVIDDCAVSGARFHGFLRQIDHPAVIFATLYTHPELREAIRRREPRVVACLSARDLGGRRIGDSGMDDDFYWSGEADALCLPWNEPDRQFWNPAARRWELAWRVVPSGLCAKNRPAPGTQPIPVLLESSVASALSTVS